MPVQFALIRNTAPSPSASRDCICNHGNKIQVQQHHHRFYEDGEHKMAKERRDTKMFTCSLRSVWDPLLSSLSPAWERLGTRTSILQCKMIPCQAIILFYLLFYAHENLCSIQFFYLKEMVNFRSKVVEVIG